MKLREEFRTARAEMRLLTLYGKFEHLIIFLLTGLLAIVIMLSVWQLMVKVVTIVFTSGAFDPTEYSVFQAIFGMIFTVIIALEFKRSLLVVAERRRGIVQVRTVILIALLAIVRKLMIIDLTETDAQKIFALAVAVVALGGVFWLVRDQDRRDRGCNEQNG